MKSFVIAGLIGAAIGVAVVRPEVIAQTAGQSGTLLDLYTRIFPEDPAMREALDLCFRQNHNFNRLDGGERANCYEQFLPSRAAAQPEGNPAVALHAANFVDLWQSAGRGHLLQNDVRAEQRSARVPHSAAAGATQ